MAISNDFLMLIKTARSGSRTSLNQLCELVSRKALLILYKNTNDHWACNDILQETLLTMIKSLPNLDNPEKFWPWIHAILNSKTKQYYRNKKRSAKDFCCPMPTQHYNTAADTLVKKEITNRLTSAIENLKKEERDIVNMRTFNQLPYRTIASITNTTQTNARLKFHRAKKSLKKQLLSLSIF